MRMVDLARLPDTVIEARLVSCENEAERQQLLALRLERDIEAMLHKMSPERAIEIRPFFMQALTSPDHMRWIDPPSPTEKSEPRVSNRDLDLSRCSAPTKTGSQCLRRAESDGICYYHRRRLNAAERSAEQGAAPVLTKQAGRLPNDPHG